MHEVGLRRVEQRAPGIAQAGIAGACTRHHCANAQQHRDYRGGLGVGKFLAHLGKMATDDVAGLVGEHANDLVWRFRFHQCAGVDENVMRVHHKRVERPVVDDDDMDVLVAQPRHLEDGLGIVTQKLLDLGVANDRQAAVGWGLRACRRLSQRKCGGGREGDDARRWPRQPRLARRSRHGHFGQRQILRSATHAMKGAGRGQHKAGVFAAAKRGTKPGEYGSTGAARDSGLAGSLRGISKAD